jgi:uncharacterized protein YndB with AHSA1/START domain
MSMRVENQVEIERSPEEVFAFVSDPTNDPEWCSRVISIEQTAGEGPGPEARYTCKHRPTPMRTLTREITVDEWQPPGRIRWRQEDDNGVFSIAYTIEPAAGGGTRITQSDDIDWKIPRIAHPFAKRTVQRHMRQQMSDLKRVLESRAA